MAERLSTWESLKHAIRSKRLGVVTLLSFSSGLPLGLVWIAIPVWLKDIGVDIRVVGLLTLFQAPWSFKFLWSPFMDRYELPFLGRRRGYVLVAQIGLFLTGLALTFASDHPERFGVIAALCLAIALISATQDIAIDAYVVEVLREDEQGLAVGARTAMYRVAMNLSGGLAISLAGLWGWTAVNLLLAVCYLPCLFITLWADEPEVRQKPPTTLREAVWEPFLGLLSRPRAIEILAFVVLFKLADAFAQSLQRPFFRELGFDLWDVGIVSSTIGTVGIMVGTVLGGLMTTSLGLGRALWITGFLQAVSNLGYAWVSSIGTRLLDPVHGDGLRIHRERSGHRSSGGHAAASDRETLFRDPVRAPLQPFCPAPDFRRPALGSSGRYSRLDELLPFDRADGPSRDGDAVAIRPLASA